MKRNARPRRLDPQPLSKALDEVVMRRRWAGRLDGARVFQLWDEVVGADLAAHVKPVRLHGGVLVVAAEDAGWASQLRYLTAELQARANSLMGPDSVRTVQIVVARPGEGRS